MEYMKGSNMPTYLAKHASLPEPVARCAVHCRTPYLSLFCSHGTRVTCQLCSCLQHISPMNIDPKLLAVPLQVVLPAACAGIRLLPPPWAEKPGGALSISFSFFCVRAQTGCVSFWSSLSCTLLACPL